MTSKQSNSALGPLLIGLAGHEISSEEHAWLRQPAVGGVVLFTRNFRDVSQLTTLTRDIRESAGRDLLICVDHEGGRVQRFRDGFTRLPPLSVLGRIHAESPALALDYAYRHARVMATELLLCGVDLSFAPVLDLGGRSQVIGDRAFAADSPTVIELARTYIAGMHDAGMAATGKHFPGHGSVEADSHTDDVCDPRAFTEIENNDLQPFRELSDTLDAVMMAHVLYPQVDPVAAGYSAYWIQTVLRQQLAYRGTVFSDDLGMFAAKVAGGLKARVEASLQAGCDAVLVCDPGDVRALMKAGEMPGMDSYRALERLKGRFTASRADVERVGEWRQWKMTIEQLEHS
ncbi:MAG: beta-N-acetylhexosaminidase [Xanthomonadales bacterium]|nr:beta-N-acetylhexosaminidase [Xanthomonadales bacterium]